LSNRDESFSRDTQIRAQLVFSLRLRDQKSLLSGSGHKKKLLFKLIELLAATDEVPIPREWDIVEWNTRLFTKSAVAMQKPSEVRTSYLLRRVLRVFADIGLDLMQ
jgi:hypothetical protein